VLVPFPFENFSTSKVRPALCITEPFGRFEHVVVAFISSKTEHLTEETELEINPLDIEWALTGLVTKSILKLHKLVSIPKSLILRELGGFPINKTSELNSKLKLIFGIE
jgi:mRNA interferase MazF